MATNKEKADARQAVIIAAQKALADSKKSFADADRIRQQAEQKGRLLRPDDILNGKVDAGKLFRYMTQAADGSVRPITLQDIKDFDRRRTELRSRWQKGIRAKDIVDLARAVVPGQKQSDLEKAKQQIHTAIPVTTKAGELKFATNSGPNSDRERHYVTIRMLNFDAAVASPTDAKKIATEVTGGPLAIGCSCGQWRFVFAYMATAGGYGLPEHRETAFPKLKNPKLSGVACKHIVKVASTLSQSPTIRSYVGSLIEKERNRTQTRMDRNAMAEQKKLLEAMKGESFRQRRIATTEEKRAERNGWKSSSAAKTAERKAKKLAENLSASKLTATLGKNIANMAAKGANNADIIAALRAQLAALEGK